MNLCEKTLTISIPAYNVEKTIDKLLLSILKCKEKNRIEVLIINDGSEDDTKKIGQKYEAKYPTIVKFIDKDNGGHGSTINCGLRLATGKYFKSIDGDDWIYTKNLDSIICKLNSSDEDIILTDYLRVFSEKKEKVTYKALIPLREYTVDSFVKMNELITYHSVIFRTSLLKNKLSIDEHRFYVDTEYCLFPLKYAKSVLYINKVLYCYWLGREGQSVSMDGRIKHLDDGIFVAKRLINFLSENKKGLSIEIQNYFVNNLVNHCSWVFDTMIYEKASLHNMHELNRYVSYLNREAPQVSKILTQKKKSYSAFLKFEYSYWLLKLAKG